MMIKQALVVCILLMVGLATAGNSFAQDSADQLLEKARAKAAEIEKLKKIINEEPDQNVRLAAFELMIARDDSLMQEIAIESGLSSADKLLQAAAFKAAIMNLDRLHLTLVVDSDASVSIQKLSQAYLDKNGDQYVLSLDNKDTGAGTFKSGYLVGQITGTRLNYTWSKSNGALLLKDDNEVSGDITHNDRGKALKFVATGAIR